MAIDMRNDLSRVDTSTLLETMDVLQRFRISRSTLARWLDRGLRHFRTSPSYKGKLLFREEDILSFLWTQSPPPSHLDSIVSAIKALSDGSARIGSGTEA